MTVLEKAGSGSIEPEDFNRVVDELNAAGPAGSVTASDVDSQAAQDGDVLTADGAGGASWAAGGSQPVKVVRVPIAFDTPGLNATAHAITAVNQGTQTVTITGTPTLTAGESVYLNGSTGNDGNYTVASSSVVAGHTLLVTVEAIPDSTADGNVNVMTGIVIYTPTPGDIFIGALIIVSISTAWDQFPSLWLGFAFGFNAGTDAEPFTGGPFDLGLPNSGPNSHVFQVAATAGSSNWIALDSEPLRVCVDNGGSAPPGSIVGEGEIILTILAAA